LGTKKCPSPRKNNPCTGEKIASFSEKIPGNGKFTVSPAKKWPALQKNGFTAKKVLLVQMRKRAVPGKNPLYAKKIVFPGKK